MRRKINAANWSKSRRTVIEFCYPELPSDQQNYWLISKPGLYLNLCSDDPGHNVDLYVAADLKAMTSAWMAILPCLLKSGAALFR